MRIPSVPIISVLAEGVRSVPFLAGEVFKQVKNPFSNIRIRLDFPRYERQCWHEHEQKAKRNFSTKQLDDERENLLAWIESKASEKYDDLLRDKEAERTLRQTMASDTEELLSYFLRQYKQELEDLHAEKDALVVKKRKLHESKSAISDALTEAYAEKDEAYSELSYYNDEIDSWYAESERTPWLLGNGGKKLPKHALFNQSFGDLDSYKESRDSAGADIEAATRPD
jgi:hypothetical protein